jgi:hypothetical protein
MTPAPRPKAPLGDRLKRLAQVKARLPRPDRWEQALARVRRELTEEGRPEADAPGHPPPRSEGDSPHGPPRRPAPRRAR